MQTPPRAPSQLPLSKPLSTSYIETSIKMPARTASGTEREPKARGDRALRQASKLPRYSADGEEEQEAGGPREREGGEARGSSKNSRRGETLIPSVKAWGRAGGVGVKSLPASSSSPRLEFA